MNKFFHWGLVFLLVETAIVDGRAEPSDQTMREVSVVFLKSVIGDVLQNPETAKYFPGVKLNDVSLSQDKWDKATGWIYRWSYEHGVHYVRDQDSQTGSKAIFEDSNAIVFAIFVSCKNGSAFVSRIRNYAVLEKPELTVSLYLKTGDENAPLQKIDEIIKSYLTAFQKAVAN
jgi:hypothetical protein